MKETDIALEIEHLTVNYGNVSALWDISLKVPKGRIVGIVGPNGAGKSTLIKTAMGLIAPISGRVSFSGLPLAQMRQKIAYVPQKESVDWDFPITVEELVLMGRYGKLGLFKHPRAADRAAVKEHLSMVGIESFASRQISQLSGGQQQRAFIARALIQGAEFYFMDEPFTGIDLTSRQVIIELLHQLRDQGKTIFVVHHELDHIRSYFDWVILMNIRLVASGPTETAFTGQALHEAYGRSHVLFDEALRLSKNESTGVR